MKTALVCGAGPSYGAVLDNAVRIAVNWRGLEPRPVLNVSADHVYCRTAPDSVPLVHIDASQCPFVRIRGNARCRLGFSGPNAVWRTCQDFDRVVLCGFELRGATPEETALYGLQRESWYAVAQEWNRRGALPRVWMHPDCRGGLDGMFPVFSQVGAASCR